MTQQTENGIFLIERHLYALEKTAASACIDMPLRRAHTLGRTHIHMIRSVNDMRKLQAMR